MRFAGGGNHDYAAGRMKAGKMNKTEVEYNAHLEHRIRAGEILWFTFEGITLKLADGCRYTVDFNVMAANGQLEMHEVKGFWRDDARVKIKVAAEKFPLKFIAITKEAKKRGGGWKFEEF